MNALDKYKYLMKPFFGMLTFYFIGSEFIRCGTNLAMLFHLTMKSYDAFLNRGKLDSLTYLTKFWILFGFILGTEFLFIMINKTIPFIGLLNTFKISFLSWLIYNPENVNVCFTYVDPYLKLVLENYKIVFDTASKYIN